MNPHKSKRFECLGVLPAGKPALRSPPNRSLPQARRGLLWRTVLLGVLLIRPSMAAPLCLSGPPMVVAEKAGMMVLWQTGSESDVLGFHLYGFSREGVASRLNPRLMPAAVADGVGAAYRYHDIPGAARYELGLVDTHGRESRVPCVRPALVPQWVRALPEMPLPQIFQRLGPTRLPSSPTAVGNAVAALPPPPFGLFASERERLKITVAEAGIYRLTAAQVADGLGMTVAEAGDRIATRQLRLTCGGQRIAWIPDTNDRALLLYHPGGKTLYSAQAVYWLERGRGLVLPPLEGPEPATAAPDRQAFSETVRFEKDVIGAVFAYNDPDADFWVWDSFNSGESKNTFSFALEAMAAPEGTIPVVVRVVGSSFATHHADVSLNHTLIGSGSFDGKSALSITCNVPAAWVLSGTNTLGLSNATASSSLFYLDYFDVTHRRLFHATRESLWCSAETNSLVTMRGFSNSAVRLVDVSDPRLAREIQGIRVEPEGNADAFSFLPRSARARYYAFSGAAIQTPLALDGWDSPGLKSATNAADYVVITSASLTNALRPLLDWRTRQGRMCRMIEVREIADEFSYGVVTPQAIRTFLAQALTQWRVPPRSVLLGGKGSYDYRNITGTAANLVPVLLVPTSTYLFASDNAFADVTGEDGVPEVALGRLPATTASEMATMVGRIIAYEQDGGGDWTQRALLTADDPDDGGNFPAASESAAAWLPPDWIPQRIYLTQYSVGTARTLLLNALNRQAVLWNYFGHGGMNVLDGGWLGTSDASLLTNGFRAPVLLGMTCFIARHEVPGYISLAETLMTRPNGGLAALWAPTGLSNHNFAQTMNSEFLRARYQRGIQPLGETLRIALASMAQLGVAKDHLQIYTLLGDPGLLMK